VALFRQRTIAGIAHSFPETITYDDRDPRDCSSAMVDRRTYRIHFGGLDSPSLTSGSDCFTYQYPRSPQGAVSKNPGGIMKPVLLIGIALILLGIVALSYERITYTTKEKVIDIGPIHATAEREKSIPLPPLLGGLALIAGIGLVAIGYKKS
jgi:hypothetical protein